MATSSNVFRGPTSVVDFYDPDRNPPLPLVEIPERLNPFRKDGVRIYAKMLTHLPGQNVKSLPALKMLKGIPDAQNKTIVEASSGSTVLSLGILARVLWGHDDVNAYVTNKKHPDSLNLLRFFGVRPHLYGGLAQQEPTDKTGIMCRLRRYAANRDDTTYPGQYDNANNWKAHEHWTGPQILKQLPEVNVICTTVGTGGCITGTAAYIKSQKPSVRALGVFNVFGDPTPGPRHFLGFNSCGFPWKDTVDAFVEVGSADSYRMSMQLSREGLITGPSSGEALRGLLDYIGQKKEAGELVDLADDTTGEVSCVFICCDLPYQYLPGYFQKLGVDEFPPIENEVLLHCDQLKHDERWILDPSAAIEILCRTVNPIPDGCLASGSGIAPSSALKISQADDNRMGALCSTLGSCFGRLAGRSSRPRYPKCCVVHPARPKSSPLILDLRHQTAFKTRHFPGSLHLPLEGLTPELAGGDLFGDPAAVLFVWNGIQALFDRSRVSRMLKTAERYRLTVLVVCYDGGASQLGTSILRDRGIEAFNVKGGYEALRGRRVKEADSTDG